MAGLLDITLQDPAGNALGDRLCALVDAATGAPVQLYTALVDGEPLASNLVTTDSAGSVIAYCSGVIRVEDAVTGRVLRSRVEVVPYLAPEDMPISIAVAHALSELRVQLQQPGKAFVYAMDLLTEAEQADVRTTGLPQINIGAKLNAWLQAAYLLYGDTYDRKGGQGACMMLHPGSWLTDGFVLRPGMSLSGLVSRFEVRVLQSATARQPLVDVLGRTQDTTDVKRRTDVHLEEMYLVANGLYGADETGAYTVPIHGIYLRPETDLQSPDENNINLTGLVALRISIQGASGTGIYSSSRGRCWLHEVQSTGNDGEGIYIQGPDCLLVKCYAGENGKTGIHIESAATPMVDHVELGVSRDPQLYPSLWIDNCTDFVIENGNCTGPLLIDGSENNPQGYDYGVNVRGVIANVIFTFKDKTFQGSDGTWYDQPGYIQVANSKGLHIKGCYFKPAENKIKDPVTGAYSYQYTRRPKNIVYVKGEGSAFSFDCPLQALADPLFPAGDPTVWPGSQPVNSYDAITNKPDQALLVFTDPTPGASAWVHDRIRFLSGGGIVGKRDGSAVAAGMVGERLVADTGSSTAVALTTNQVAQIAQLTLQAGTWDVLGALCFTAAAATVQSVEGCIALDGITINATTVRRYAGQAVGLAGVTGPVATLQIGPSDFRVTAPTVRSLNARAAFSAGSMAAYGVVEARRMA